jgi:hypothetical protein
MEMPYKYKIGSLEARNYVLEDYEIKRIGHYSLVSRDKHGNESEIGRWHVSDGIAQLCILDRLPEMNEQDFFAYEEICRVTKKRIENDLE